MNHECVARSTTTTTTTASRGSLLHVLLDELNDLRVAVLAGEVERRFAVVRRLPCVPSMVSTTAQRNTT